LNWTETILNSSMTVSFVRFAAVILAMVVLELIERPSYIFIITCTLLVEHYIEHTAFSSNARIAFRVLIEVVFVNTDCIVGIKQFVSNFASCVLQDKMDYCLICI